MKLGTYTQIPEKLAGLRLDYPSLRKLYVRWLEEEQTWPVLEIDYLIAWEENFKGIPAVRWPTYSAKYVQNGVTIQVGQQFFKQMKNLHNLYGHDQLLRYIQFCIRNWVQIRLRYVTTACPDILFIVKNVPKLLPISTKDISNSSTQYSELSDESDFTKIL